jgi:DNA-binding response OmpR family regulator
MTKKILFINKANPVSIVPEILAQSGYEVFEPGSAGEDLSCLGTGSYHLIILLENAGAQCWELCAMIRQQTASPLIVISSGSSTENCVKAIAAGADFFMRKPFGPMELMSRVNTLLQRLPARQPVPAAS